MAVLEKIRVKFGLAVSIIIALALLSFIIDPGTLETALNSMSSKYDVGVINGKAVSYNDFLGDVERYNTINEIITGSSVQNEQAQKQIRDAAWQELVDKFLFIKNAKAAGFTVGNAEMLDLTMGSGASPVLAQNPAFAGEDGTFDPQRVADFVEGVSSDETGRLQTYWNFLQTSVYTQQFYAKYGSLFAASAFQNALEKKLAIDQNNTTANVDFVYVTYPFEKDSTISVSSSEIRKYYKEHRGFFEQKASRDIEYVVFEVIPSAADIAAANDQMAKAYDEFGGASNMKAFLLRNSDRQYNDYWYRKGELNSINSEVNNFVFDKGNGVSPIYTRGNSFYAVRVLESAQVPDSVYVKHILLQGAGARQKADSLCAVVRKGGKFSALAAEFSADRNSAADGELGNIGWMTQTYMIPGFESVITAKLNQPEVIDTRYGSHVVVVSRRTAPVAKKKVAILEKTALPGKETFNKYYSQANRFATIAGHTEAGYMAAVDSLGVYSHRMNVKESTENYGSIDQAREVTRWVFDAKKGKASDIITVNNKYFVVAVVKNIHKEGYTPVEEVSENIRENLYSRKLAEAKKAEIAGKIEGVTSLEEIAEILGATVENESALGFTSSGSRSNDPAFAGAVFAAEDGVISGPVAGSFGTYVFKVNSRETGSFYTEEDAANYAAQKAQYTSSQIVPAMSADGVVKDNRARFF